MIITAERAIEADADAVFDLVTDPNRLAEWNAIVARTVEAPDELVPGAQWVVELAALGQTWRSRSTVVAMDRAARRFTYRSMTDDGNPSYADWTWSVGSSGTGCVVAVTFDLHPATFWRRVLLGKIRARQLRRNELPHSLDQLAQVVASPHAP